MGSRSPIILKSRQSLPMGYNFNVDILNALIQNRLPPRPTGDTYDPHLDIRNCILKPPPQKTRIMKKEEESSSTSQAETPQNKDPETSSPQNKDPNTSSPQNKDPNTSSPQKQDDIITENDNQTDTKLNSTKKHHHHHKKNKDTTEIYQPKARNLTKSKIKRIKTSSYIHVSQRKSQGSFHLPQQPDLEHPQYPPITISVPSYKIKTWKYPSRASCGTSMCPTYQKFVQSLT